MSGLDLQSFNVKYAGWIQEIRSDIDPMSKIDLLKIIDNAEQKITGNSTEGHINVHLLPDEFEEDAVLKVGYDGIIIHPINRDQEILLTIPINMIASIGVVTEDLLNIVPIKIGSDNEINDLAIIYSKTKEQALNICNHMNSCFQVVYQQSISNVKKPIPNKMKLYGSEYVDAGVTSLQSPAVITEYSQTLSSSTASSPQNEEMINEYITMISLCLSQEELNQFAILMKSWRQGEIRIKEFGKKLLEIFGSDRKHLLGRMRHLLGGVPSEDLDQLNKFLLENGVTENAATSPQITAEMSLTTNGCSPAIESISGSSGVIAPSSSK